MMATGATYRRGAGRRLHARSRDDGRTARPRRSRLHHRRHQGGGRSQDRRHHHRRAPADRRRPARASSRAQPVVFCGLFPVDAADFENLRDSLGKLHLNDASFHYEMETSAALGLRLPLRIPRPAASRDHPGAAGARVQPRPHHHRAERRLQDPPDRRHDDGAAQSGRHAGPDEDRAHRGAVDQGDHPGARRVSGLDPEAVRGPARHARST